VASETGIVRMAPVQITAAPDSVLKAITAEAEVLFKSGMFPQHKSLAAITTICLKAHELGIGAVWALQKFYLDSKGRLGTFSDAMLALALQRGITFTVKQCDEKACEFLFERWDNPRRCPMTFLSRFTRGDAERAGLMTKDTYMNYPTDLLKAKCIYRGLNTLCPDYIAGLTELTSLGAMMQPDGSGGIAPVCEPESGLLVLEPEFIEEETQEFDGDETPGEAITESEFEAFRQFGRELCEKQGVEPRAYLQASKGVLEGLFPGKDVRMLTMDQLTVLEDRLNGFDYDSLADTEGA
jgi:hypothetical protein